MEGYFFENSIQGTYDNSSFEVSLFLYLINSPRKSGSLVLSKEKRQ